MIVNRVPVKPVTESLQDTGYDGTEMIAYLQKKCSCIVIDAEKSVHRLARRDISTLLS